MERQGLVEPWGRDRLSCLPHSVHPRVAVLAEIEQGPPAASGGTGVAGSPTEGS